MDEKSQVVTIMLERLSKMPHDELVKAAKTTIKVLEEGISEREKWIEKDRQYIAKLNQLIDG